MSFLVDSFQTAPNHDTITYFCGRTRPLMSFLVFFAVSLERSIHVGIVPPAYTFSVVLGHHYQVKNVLNNSPGGR